jgi:RHS repeat-associated protein
VDVTFNTNRQVLGLTTKQTATAAAANVATALTYQPMSDLLKSITHGNGLVTTAGYDLDYRLTGLNVKNGTTVVQGSTYAYGDGINLTGITDTVAAANSNTLSYSPANRLASASGAWGSAAYAYDPVGNRLSDVVTGSVNSNRQATMDSFSNRLMNMTENGAALRSYTYDGAGNIITDVRPGETYAYTYNKRNRLASVTRNGVAYATYTYNALEQLTSRTTSAAGGPVGTIHYVYDLDGHLIVEADAATGATLREYIWLPANDNHMTTAGGRMGESLDLSSLAANDNNPIDLPLAIVDTVNTTPTLLMVHSDHLGRPTRLTDATKATVWQASYKPWGEVQSMSGTRTQNLRFPGQYFQIETNLAYNHHRHYDPTTGRYTQPDPLGFVDGPSVYAYAGGSPLMNTDPEGLASPGSAGRGRSAAETKKAQQCASSCLNSALGLEAATGASLLGATPVPKKWLGLPVLPSSSSLTNPISLSTSRRLPFDWKAFGTKRLGGALGRANVWVSAGMCVATVFTISACTKQCMEN